MSRVRESYWERKTIDVLKNKQWGMNPFGLSLISGLAEDKVIMIENLFEEYIENPDLDITEMAEGIGCTEISARDVNHPPLRF